MAPAHRIDLYDDRHRNAAGTSLRCCMLASIRLVSVYAGSRRGVVLGDLRNAMTVPGLNGLFLWHAGGGTTEVMDEDLTRRLRALGYLH